MASNSDNQCNEIPQNIQKNLFAEDLINYVLQKYSLPAILLSTELQRERSTESDVSLFDNNLKIAADFINNISGFETELTYRFLMDNNLKNISWFNFYATSLKANFFKSVSYPESFFHYSVHLAHLAAKLYAREVKEAPIKAVHYILEVMDLDRFISGKAIFDLLALKYTENQQLSIEKVEQSSLQRKDESFVHATDVQRRVPHGHINQCEVNPENIHEEVFKDKMDEDIATISSSSSSQSQSYSRFEIMRPFTLNPSNINPCNVLSSDSISVPRPFRGKAKKLHSHEYYSADWSKDNNSQRKKPRLDYGI